MKFSLSIVACSVLGLTALTAQAQTVYFGYDNPRASLALSTAARNSFLASLDTSGTDTIESFTVGTPGSVNPLLSFGGGLTAQTNGPTAFEDIGTAFAVSGTHYLLDGAATSDTFTFNAPVNGFGTFIVNAGDMLNTNTISIVLENVALGTSKTAFSRTFGPNASDTSVFFIGVTDTAAFDRVRIVETTDAADGILFDNVSAGRFAPVTVSGIVALQGTQNAVQPVNFTFRPTLGSAFTRTTTLNFAGGYTISDVPVGEYTVSIKGAKWLRKNITVDARSGIVTNANATLLAGDANNDNAVDISDLLLLINAYNQLSPHAGFSDAADFNCDGGDDIADLLLLVGNYNKQGDS